MAKGLFTSLEEIEFQNTFVKGHVRPVQNPNRGHFQKEIRHSNKQARLCSRKINKTARMAFSSKIR